MKKYASICIHFDSLGEAYGFPKNYSDPTFTKVADRFFQLSSKYDFKYTINVIGKDLEQEANRNEVYKWAKEGHEIGNHSWSHKHSISTMKEDLLYDEIKKSHDIITDTVGVVPKGFASPGWAVSDKLYRILLDFGYEYDTSIVPSFLLHAALVKIYLSHLKSSKIFDMLKRKDFVKHLLSSRKPKLFSHKNRKLIKLPMPTNRFRLSCWHSLAFVMSWKLYEKLLTSCLNQTDAFHYLVHPADLLVKSDLRLNSNMFLERIDIGLDHKMFLLESSIKKIINSGRKIITLNDMAKIYLK